MPLAKIIPRSVLGVSVRPLNPDLRKQLKDVLIHVFDQSSLEQFAIDRLEFEDVRLIDLVNPDKSTDEISSRIIQDADQRRYVEELIRGIERERRNIPEVVALVAAFGLQAKGATKSMTMDGLRKAVAAFNKSFSNRNKLFKYLKAYKELHDVLHELQSFHTPVVAGVAKRMADPSQPLAEDVAFFLKDKDKKASENVKDIEFPDKPPAWIAKRAAVVKVITGPDVEKMPPMPAQVERLKTLPSEGLGPLNDKLFENATLLNPNQRIAPLNDILSAID